MTGEMSRIESTCTLGRECNTHAIFKDFEDLINDAETETLYVGACDEKTHVSKLINGGAFGVIFIGRYLPTKERVAVKMEKQNSGYEKILAEGNTMRHLENHRGIPKVYTFGMHGAKYNYLVEELLGHSLSAYLEKHDGQFSLKTVLLLIDQIVDLMEYVHGQGYVHKDISPSNFVMGRNQNKHQVYIIDFGLAKKVNRRGSFLMEGHRKSFTIPHSLDGTPRYASCGAHQGDGEHSKDDMEALGYMWVYMLKGGLPWQGIEARTHLEKLGKIFEVKMSLSGRDICTGVADEFALYIDYCRNLKGSETPNYSAFKKMFRDLAAKHNIEYDFVFDWTKVPSPSDFLSPSVYLRCESATSPRSLVTHKKLRQPIMSQKQTFKIGGDDVDDAS